MRKIFIGSGQLEKFNFSFIRDVGVIIAVSLAVSQVAFATTNDPPIKSVDNLISVLNKILFWVANIFWIVAITMIFYAAFLYLTAGDNPERIKKAHSQLLYALIAIAIGVLAYGIPTLVQDILTPSATPPPS